MSSTTPRNRKERRAAAKDVRSADSIPMAQPDRSGPKAKTLFELAAEREAILSGRRRAARPANDSDPSEEPSVVTINPDGTLSGPDGEPLPDAISDKIKASMESGPAGPSATTAPDESPLADALLYTVTLSMLFFTLTVLVTQQYGMTRDLDWSGMIWKTASNAPFLFFSVHLLHPRADAWWTQMLFLAMSIGCGWWMITASSEYGYMAVMKRAPGVGTLWVWAVLESRLEVGLVGLVAVGSYFWYGGHSIFT